MTFLLNFDMLFLLYPFHFCTVNVKAKDQSCKAFWLNNSGLFVGLVQQPHCIFTGGALAPVVISALDAAQRHTADDELGEQQVDDDHRQDGDGHHHVHLAHIELEEVCAAQLCN